MVSRRILSWGRTRSSAETTTSSLYKRRLELFQSDKRETGNKETSKK
jgi:hypothetical protein